MVSGTPFATLCDILQQESGDFRSVRIINNMQCPLDIDNLMFFYCALECAKLMKPCCGILGCNIELVPASGGFGGCQAAEKIGDPCRNIGAKT